MPTQRKTTPSPNLHALQNDPHAISGHVVVPGFAGGTANTEFDVLTGMQTNALSAATTSAFRVVNRNLDSVLRVFGSDGYHTSFFHPGDDWFYNRENVYRWMGAEETVFVDQMEDLTTRAAGSPTTIWPDSSRINLKRRWKTGSFFATTPPPSKTTCPTPPTSTARTTSIPTFR